MPLSPHAGQLILFLPPTHSLDWAIYRCVGIMANHLDWAFHLVTSPAPAHYIVLHSAPGLESYFKAGQVVALGDASFHLHVEV